MSNLRTYNEMGHGLVTVTTAGTAVQFTATDTPCHLVVVQAMENNTGQMCVGISTVDETAATRKGVLLQPGESWDVYINNVDKLYADSSVNGEKVSYTYFRG